MKRSAIFDGKYRYSLSRTWDEGKGKVVFIMLNPSLADDIEDDQTTKRCINFSKKFGYGSLEIVNLFAYITSQPSELRDLDKTEAIGRENYKYIVRALNNAEKIIVAWGENGTIHQRHKEVEELIGSYDIDCLGPLTRDGHPRHPLYLSNDVELLPFKRPEKKVIKLVRTAPVSDAKATGGEGILIDDGDEMYDDSWMWCKECLEDFRLENLHLCRSCFEKQMKDFKEFLIQEYTLGEKSAEDYVGRLKGIINKGLYNNEDFTPALKASIRENYPNSKNHYVLALERYIEFQKKTLVR
ncbi:MAG TPA: DUF1643 domain-containing protein [Ureibacillus sp.]|nr:DUF1643 domain-containing protein [Ureibacillus sp.]